VAPQSGPLISLSRILEEWPEPEQLDAQQSPGYNSPTNKWGRKEKEMLFLLLKWLHILAAITAVGSNITYGIWIGRASARSEVLPFTLRGIKLIDDRLANPAYGLLLITGLLMVWVARFLLTTPWLLIALILYAALILLGLFGFTPALKRQIAALEEFGPGSEEYRSVAARGTLLGLVLTVLAVAIVFLMVVKPTLWG
jgi:uncharacterized membrane protein